LDLYSIKPIYLVIIYLIFEQMNNNDFIYLKE